MEAKLCGQHLGCVFFDQALLPKLRQAKTAKSAIISSMMASRTRAGGHTYAYCASKAAVLNIGRTLAAELRPDAISVSIFKPGWVPHNDGN
ncbi:SDR family NAD(P)-dependent oxidoreductase [Rhodobacteraceae bacterium Araon29]